MEQNGIRQKLRQKQFIVLAELVGGPGFSFRPIEQFLKAYQEASSDKRDVALAGFDLAGITLPQSPGGVANIDPASVISTLQASDLLDGLDIIPHISCKDHNSDAITSALMGYKQAGVTSVLALTGDKPAKSKGVFELESVGLLRLIRQINHQAYLSAQPQSLSRVHQFNAGAAVSPFKYTEAAQMQQYYKMEKKIRSGAAFLITQVGWDWRKSLELFTYLRERNLHIPVIGNVYLLSTLTPAPRLMHDIKLPGCFVSDELLAKVYSEGLDDHLERAAQQVALYKALGAAGVDIGGVPNFELFARILRRAAEIGTHWEPFKDNLCWHAKEAFYLYDQSGAPVALSQPRSTLGKKFFDFSHRAFLDPKHAGFHALKKTMRFVGAAKGKGAAYKLFNSDEKWFKYLLFDCQECGDCYLPENFGLCTIGGCEKGLDNAPCGDATVDGRCGNNLDHVCKGDLIYQAASSEPGGRERLRATINKPRNPALKHTSSIINYLFARDHTMPNAIISIGESVHASIPKTGQIMKELLDDCGLRIAECGLKAADSSNPKSGIRNPQLDYIRALIESQAADGADYIAVNLDAFGEDDPQMAVDMMVEYTRLVRQWSDGVPICIDSSNDDVLIAGLKEWYATSEPVKAPLINSVKVYTMDRILPLKKEYDFSFIGLLVSEDKPTGPGGSHSVDELYSLAQQLFEKAVGQYGFAPEHIFFDSTVFPIAIDMPMEPGVPGYTYRTFETIRRIKSDPAMKGVHCSLGISNSVRDLPGRRIGVCRAYVAKAMEYGLDAGIVNAAHHYGTVEADPALLELVDAYAKLDGSAEATGKAMDLMSKFCRENRKPT
ncbi:MAG: methylenetetrahydrofolate reductase C-terminal domain-containing protein [Sedimentisphaerales bacterium]|nr:methylenetetrahydrofolate reductase C-terminal domain-containing protein [Sedimentisphaerales bacterium]